MTLTTPYLGLKLAHPFILGASPVTGHLDNVRRAEDGGCAAIVMHSLFEEQIAETAAGKLPEFEQAAREFLSTLSHFSRPGRFPLGPEEYLEQLRAQFSAAYPDLTVRPALCDISRELKLPGMLNGPLLIAFLGSTIGNFEPREATALLQRVAAVMRPGDRVLVGFDLKKDLDVLQRAYADSEGVTAAFNLNLLQRINDEFHADFVLERWRHHSYYNPITGASESYLVSLVEQQVHIPDLRLLVPFQEFEAHRDSPRAR